MASSDRASRSLITTKKVEIKTLIGSREEGSIILQHTGPKKQNTRRNNKEKGGEGQHPQQKREKFRTEIHPPRRARYSLMISSFGLFVFYLW